YGTASANFTQYDCRSSLSLSKHRKNNHFFLWHGRCVTHVGLFWEVTMRMSFLRAALLGGLMAAGAFSAPAAWAIPIQVAFNFVPNGALTANTGDVTNATTITPGAPDTVTQILLN